MGCEAVYAGGGRLLARMLGIHITLAVAWQRASSGDWSIYAAEISRRNTIDPDKETRP